MTATYVYVLGESVLDPVVRSQTLRIAARLAEEGHDAQFWCFANSGTDAERRVFLEETEGRLSAQFFGRTRSPQSGVERLWRAAQVFGGRFRAARAFDRMVTDRKVILHGRAAGAPMAYALTRRAPSRAQFIYDIRGDAVAEAAFRGASPASLRSIEDAERGLVSEAAGIVCVSTALLARVSKRSAIRPGTPALVVPCVADERRFKPSDKRREQVRRALGYVSSESVVVYSGGLDRWHAASDLFQAFAELARTRGDARFLVVSPDVEVAAEAARSLGLRSDKLRIVSAAPADVPGYLDAGDVAILLRDAHPLNAVASPTKFAEYALAGLPMVVSGGIGDTADYLSDLSLGVCVDSNEPSVVAAGLARAMTRTEERQERAQGAAARLSIASALPSFRSLRTWRARAERMGS